MINNTNVFAALDTLKKKKKSDKSNVSSNSKSKSQSHSESESESKVFWAPAPLNATSWADVDDDDDYFATTAPPQSHWNVPQPPEEKPGNFEVRYSILYFCFFVFLYVFFLVMLLFDSIDVHLYVEFTLIASCNIAIHRMFIVLEILQNIFDAMDDW